MDMNHFFELMDELLDALEIEEEGELDFDDLTDEDEEDSENEDFGTEDDLPFDPVGCDEDCYHCEDRCDAFEEYGYWKVPLINKVIYNPPATVVLWMDGTKTVVKCTGNDHYDRYMGFAAAVVKKMFGSKSRLSRFLDNYAEDQSVKSKEQG